jgi:hypothetical protein
VISQLFQDVDAPRLDHGAEARLRRLDARLAVTFSQWAIDPLTSHPIEADPEAGGGAIEDAAWHLWIKHPEHGWLHVHAYYVVRGEWFGHEQIGWLEADLGRTKSPDEILRMFAQRRAEHTQKCRAAYDQNAADHFLENKRRIHDLLFNGKSGMRERKIMAYPGQTNHSTPSEKFLSDAREDGWVSWEDQK